MHSQQLCDNLAIAECLQSTTIAIHVYACTSQDVWLHHANLIYPFGWKYISVITVVSLDSFVNVI